MKNKEIKSLTVNLESYSDDRKAKIIDSMISQINTLLLNDSIQNVDINHIFIVPYKSQTQSIKDCLIITIVYTIYYDPEIK